MAALAVTPRATARALLTKTDAFRRIGARRVTYRACAEHGLQSGVAGADARPISERMRRWMAGAAPMVLEVLRMCNMMRQAGVAILAGALVVGAAAAARAGTARGVALHGGQARPMGAAPHGGAAGYRPVMGGYGPARFAGGGEHEHGFGSGLVHRIGAAVGYGLGVGYGAVGYGGDDAPAYDAPAPIEEPQVYSHTYVVPTTVYQPVTRTYTVPVRSYRTVEQTHYVPVTQYRPVTSEVQVPAVTYQTYQRTEQVPTTVYRRVQKTCSCSYATE